MIWRRVMLGAFATIGYVLVGYPLAVITVARLSARREESPRLGQDELPDVTVVVAAYNEESVIGQRVENLLQSDYPSDRLSVLVVADGSDDGTVDIVRSIADPRVRVTADGPRRGKSAALTRVFPMIESEIVVFSDANNSYEADGLAVLVSNFADPDVGAVTGAKRVLPDAGKVGLGESVYWRYESLIKESETTLGSCVAVTGEMLAIRRSLLHEVPAEVINDDFYLALGVLREGADVVYEPRAVSWEPPSMSVGDDRLRRERIVAGRIQALAMARRLLPWRRPLVTWQVVSHKLLRPFVPMLAMLGLGSTVLALLSAARSRRGVGLPVTALAGQAVFYAAAKVGQSSEDPGFVPKVASYLVDSHRSSLVGALNYLRGQRQVAWEKAERPDPTVASRGR